jgi:hypothetical protein
LAGLVALGVLSPRRHEMGPEKVHRRTKKKQEEKTVDRGGLVGGERRVVV